MPTWGSQAKGAADCPARRAARLIRTPILNRKDQSFRESFFFRTGLSSRGSRQNGSDEGGQEKIGRQCARKGSPKPAPGANISALLKPESMKGLQLTGTSGSR